MIGGVDHNRIVAECRGNGIKHARDLFVHLLQERRIEIDIVAFELGRWGGTQADGIDIERLSLTGRFGAQILPYRWRQANASFKVKVSVIVTARLIIDCIIGARVGQHIMGIA